MKKHTYQKPLWCLAGVAFVAAAAAPAFMSDFHVYQFSLMLTYAMAILGVNLLLGMTGQVSLAQGVFFACGAYTTAILISQYEVHYLVALASGVATSGLLGVAIGAPVLRLQGLQLAIVTFGLAALVPQLILKLDSITKGTSGISFDKALPPGWFPGNQESWIFTLCLAGLLICVVTMWRLIHGDTGRSLRAVRDNSLIACSLGVNIANVRLMAFTVSSAYAGLGGGLFAMLSGFVGPDAFTALKSIDFLVGSVVGGMASITGAFFGAFFVLFLPEWTAEINLATAGLVYGGCLVITMLLMKDGFMGLTERVISMLLKRRARHDRVKEVSNRGSVSDGRTVDFVKTSK